MCDAANRPDELRAGLEIVEKDEVALDIHDDDGRSSRLRRGKTAAFEAMAIGGMCDTCEAMRRRSSGEVVGIG